MKREKYWWTLLFVIVYFGFTGGRSVPNAKQGQPRLFSPSENDHSRPVASVSISNRHKREGTSTTVLDALLTSAGQETPDKLQPFEGKDPLRVRLVLLAEVLRTENVSSNIPTLSTSPAPTINPTTSPEILTETKLDPIRTRNRAVIVPPHGAYYGSPLSEANYKNHPERQTPNSNVVGVTEIPQRTNERHNQQGHLTDKSNTTAHKESVQDNVRTSQTAEAKQPTAIGYEYMNRNPIQRHESMPPLQRTEVPYTRDYQNTKLVYRNGSTLSNTGQVGEVSRNLKTYETYSTSLPKIRVQDNAKLLQSDNDRHLAANYYEYVNRNPMERYARRLTSETTGPRTEVHYLPEQNMQDRNGGERRLGAILSNMGQVELPPNQRILEANSRPYSQQNTGRQSLERPFYREYRGYDYPYDINRHSTRIHAEQTSNQQIIERPRLSPVYTRRPAIYRRQEYYQQQPTDIYPQYSSDTQRRQYPQGDPYASQNPYQWYERRQASKLVLLSAKENPDGTITYTVADPSKIDMNRLGNTNADPYNTGPLERPSSSAYPRPDISVPLTQDVQAATHNNNNSPPLPQQNIQNHSSRPYITGTSSVMTSKLRNIDVLRSHIYPQNYPETPTLDPNKPFTSQQVMASTTTPSVKEVTPLPKTKPQYDDGVLQVPKDVVNVKAEQSAFNSQSRPNTTIKGNPFLNSKAAYKSYPKPLGPQPETIHTVYIPNVNRHIQESIDMSQTVPKKHVESAVINKTLYPVDYAHQAGHTRNMTQISEVQTPKRHSIVLPDNKDSEKYIFRKPKVIALSQSVSVTFPEVQNQNSKSPHIRNQEKEGSKILVLPDSIVSTPKPINSSSEDENLYLSVLRDMAKLVVPKTFNSSDLNINQLVSVTDSPAPSTTPKSKVDIPGPSKPVNRQYVRRPPTPFSDPMTSVAMDFTKLEVLRTLQCITAGFGSNINNVSCQSSCLSFQSCIRAGNMVFCCPPMVTETLVNLQVMQRTMEGMGDVF